MSVRHLPFVLCCSVVLATGCVANNSDCAGGPTSDWPFCGGGAPSLGSDEAQGGDGRDTPDVTGSTGGSGSVADSGGDAGFGGTTGEVPAGDNGGALPGATTGGSMGGTGADGGSESCGAGDGCFGGLTGGASDQDGDGIPDAQECGGPLDCAIEVDLTGADQKSLSGAPPLEFTEASVDWRAESPSHLRIYLRALDDSGQEVRLAVHFDEAAMNAVVVHGVAGPEQVAVVACGGVRPGPIEAHLELYSLGWSAGFHGLLTFEGEGWSAEVEVWAPGFCPVD